MHTDVFLSNSMFSFSAWRVDLIAYIQAGIPLFDNGQIQLCL